MQAKVKEFFNRASRELKQLDRPLRRRRRVGYMSMHDPDVPDFTDFSHFIECEVSPMICPMLWEELEIDFDNIDKRYCEYCEKYVYRADNEYMVEKLQEENKCMAVSDELLNRVNGTMNQKEYENLQKRLVVSKLFLVYKKYEPEFFEAMKEDNLSYEEQLKRVVLDVLEGNTEINIKWLMESGVDVEFLFFEIV